MDIVNIIRTILTSGLPCCILAIGIFITFRLLDFADMTAEGSFLLGGALTGLVLIKTNNPVLATLAGAAAGAVCGFITGVLNRLLKIPKLLSGIITMTASGSMAFVVFSIATNSFWSASIEQSSLTSSTIFSIFPIMNGFGIPLVMGIIVLIVALIVYFFFGTEYGMAIRATGMNERMARAQGINTTAATIAGVAISNALIGLAGALYIQNSRCMYATSATGYLIVGLASILIGEAIFGKRSFKNSLISVCLGAILYFSIIQIATFVFNMPTELTKLLYAILIVIALCLPLFKKWVSKLFKKRKSEESEVK